MTLQDTLLFLPQNTNQVYSLIDGKAYPRYTLDLGNYSPSYEQMIIGMPYAKRLTFHESNQHIVVSYIIDEEVIGLHVLDKLSKNLLESNIVRIVNIDGHLFLRLLQFSQLAYCDGDYFYSVFPHFQHRQWQNNFEEDLVPTELFRNYESFKSKVLSLSPGDFAIVKFSIRSF